MLIAKMKEKQSSYDSTNDSLAKANKIGSELKKYLQNENCNIAEIINIVCSNNETTKFKYNLLNKNKELIYPVDPDFAICFINFCKKLCDVKCLQEVVNNFSDLKNLLMEKTDIGIGITSFSAILHCIQPLLIPVLCDNNIRKKPYSDILDICPKNFKSLSKKDKTVNNFVDNLEIIHAFCGEKLNVYNTEKGYDFALIDDFLRALAENNGGVAENESTTEYDVGNAMNEDINIEFDMNMILFGPPGTGKTYNTVIYAVAICGGEVKGKDYPGILTQYNELKKSGRIAFTTFHQSYGYEEFIEGIKPVMENGQNSADSNANEDAKETNNEADNKSKDVKYEIKSGVFKSFCDVAKKDPDNSYVFIIDEINRGNISKIFGELITLIEPTKRTGEAEAMEAILPYSNEPFGVPNNVYIIGTMNTADRSIALMDTALRRRFQFVEMLPDPEVLKGIKINNTIDVEQLLTDINKRIEYLYDREHTIGHAFFTCLLNDKKRNVKELGKIFEKSVIPLLQEYFYDDYKKIMLVLGYDPKPNDNNKTNQSPNKQEYKKPDQLIIATKLEKSSIFKGDTSDIDIPEYSYEIVKDAFDNIESYTKICDENKNNSKQE